MNDKNYFAEAPVPSGVNPPFAGFVSFINLKTGVLKGKDATGDTLTSDELIGWAAEANE